MADRWSGVSAGGVGFCVSVGDTRYTLTDSASISTRPRHVSNFVYGHTLDRNSSPFLRTGLDLESGLKNGLGCKESTPLIGKLERLGLASSSLHHELGPINK